MPNLSAVSPYSESLSGTLSPCKLNVLGGSVPVRGKTGSHGIFWAGETAIPGPLSGYCFSVKWSVLTLFSIPFFAIVFAYPLWTF